MRTRSQSKRQPQVSHDSESATSSEAKPKRARGRADAPLDEPTEALPKRAKKETTLRGDKRGKECVASKLEDLDEVHESLTKENKQKVTEEHAHDSGLKGFSVASEHTIVGKEGAGGSIHYTGNELDWEDGAISVREQEEHSHEIGRDITIEFIDTQSSVQGKPSRRVSAQEKELAELVHKVHLLCLLARGRIVDAACNEPIIQASLLSLLPSNLLNLQDVQNLTADKLLSIVNWFSSNFRVQSWSSEKETFKENLELALQSHVGTAEEIAALSVALFRALNLTTRFVSILDVASLKPDADAPETSNQDVPNLDTRIDPCEGSKDMKHGKKELSSVCKKNSNNQMKCATICTKSNILDVHDTKPAEGSKRKGDLEFELQMEMALSATSAMVQENKVYSRNGKSFPNPLSEPAQEELNQGKVLKLSSMSRHSGFGAVWSRKTGPPLYWAEVYCSGETLSGRWVHVDAANAIVDGAEKVESAAAACRKMLKYVVAFAGNGAKDVTRRYCMHWYKITSKRIRSQWWDMVLAPLKQLESAVTGDTGLSTEGNKAMNLQSAACLPGVASRDSIEDMELTNRALTEPLPTNQLAYRRHELYAIERWLTKNQILHPKGPILGYCSGHPVYPRSCVQTLQTKQRWLREGLQVRASEVAAKVIERSKKSVNIQTFELDIPEADYGESNVELYGKWQLEPLKLPHAVNGIVPKNERGQVEVWSEKCLPPGTVHLRFPRLVPIVRRLEIDFAPAMVGFEFRNGRCVPMFEGIVVCTEFKNAILEAYAEEEERRENVERRRNETQALSRWFQLLSSIITRQRLKNSYIHSTSVGMQDVSTNKAKNVPVIYTTQMTSVSEEGSKPDVSHVLPDDHEHVFPLQDQSFDEKISVRIKRCPCGFSIQVEEL